MSLFHFLTEESIESLRNHRYVPAEYTLLDGLMNPFWEAVARMLPRCCSPNLVSLIGGLFALLSVFASIAAATMQNNAFLYCASGLCIFMYMTLDAVDGKHARNTRQSSPLGAMIDHGVDALIAGTISLAFLVTIDASMAMVGPVPTMLALSLFRGAWFCAQWVELETGVLDARGITEAEFITMFVLSLPGFTRLDVYKSVLPLPFVGPYPLGAAAVWFAGTLSTLAILAQVATTVWKKSGKVHYAPLLKFCLHTAAAMTIAASSVFGEQQLLLLVVVSLDACVLMTKMRLVATTHCPWPLEHADGVPYLALAGACAAGVDLGAKLPAGLIAWQVLGFVLLWRDTVTRVCACLGIPFIQQIPEKPE